MSCRGVHFALTPDEVEKLLSAKDDDELIEIIQEEIEEEWNEEWLRETDKAWDAIHRCLTDGTLSYDNGTFPLKACVLGGKQLHQGDEYIVSLVDAEKVCEVSDALKKITKEFLRERYFAIDQSGYDADICDDDFDYTWDWFKDLPSLFEAAYKDGRAILFTVDQ